MYYMRDFKKIYIFYFMMDYFSFFLQISFFNFLSLMNTAIIVVLFACLLAVNAGIDFSSCARMDVPIANKAAQALCISSCKFQNCGTGHCEKRGGRPTCVCGRCGLGGGEWPSIPIPKGGKGGKGKR
ncbi:unnamed protein product [Toxocara canis]|uniref:Uncharacterized protein n=1 Tax=Toxocara canis TaxID=6265 RepID=A0A183TVC6_TOXCA|nr:unnamed protein product [Toxocara canis]